MEYYHITVNELLKQQHEGVFIPIVDIRDKASFEQAHIPSSVRLDNENLAQYIADADLDKPLIVVCYHGISSQTAAAYLCEQGFDEVYSLDGGIVAWLEAQK